MFASIALLFLTAVPQLATAHHVGTDQVSTETNSDHGNAAATRTGWICLPWNYNNANKGINARIYRIDADTDELLSQTGTISLATSGTTFYASETCAKPFAAALSDDSFVVTWERQNAATGAAARLECARIYWDGITWAVDRASAGVGHAIDESIDPGGSDANCRTLGVNDGYFFVSYSSKTADVAGPPHERTYTMRTGVFSWLVSGAPVSVATKLYSGQHWDDANNTITGGFLLSHSDITRRGDVFLVWENRDWNGSVYDSSIQYRILSGPYSAAPLTEVATGTIATSTSATLALRRPFVSGKHPRLYRSATTTSGASEMVLVYGEENIATPGDSAAKMRVLSLYNNTLSGASVTWTANFGLNGNLDRLGSACAVNGTLLEGGIAVANYDSDAGRYLSLQHTNGTTHEVMVGTPLWPDRPFALTLPLGGNEYFILSYEGRGVTGSNTNRHLDVWRLN